MKKEIDKKKLRQDYAIQTIFTNILTNNTTFDGTITSTTLDTMLLDSDISGAINSVKAKVLVYNVDIVAKYGEIDEEKDEKVKELFKHLNFRRIVEEIVYSKYLGFTVQEIMYDEKYIMTELKKKPREWFSIYWDQVEKCYKWYFNYLTGSTVNNSEVPEGKFLFAQNKPYDLYPAGVAELEPLYKYWKIKENALSYSNEIVEKYGGIITWFVYNEDTDESELQDMVDGLANVQDGSIIPIPAKPGGVQQGLDKEFGFINTKDLTNDIHKNMIEFCKEQISEYILGNSLTQRTGDVGSYAAASVANDVRLDIIHDVTRYVSEELNKLLRYYEGIFNIDLSNYTFDLTLDEDIDSLEETKAKKLDNYKKIKEIGYQVSMDYISKELKIPIKELFQVEESASLEFAKKKNNKQEILKKNANKFKKDTEEVEKDIIKKLSEIYLEQFKKIKTKEDILKISTDWNKTDFDKVLTISKLKGKYDVLKESEKQLEFEILETDNVFKVQFNEAIKFFANKEPRLIEDVENEEIETANKIFWIKKATDLEAVKKLQNSLDKTLKNGGTFKRWKDDIEEIANREGFGTNGWYLETVFRTNVLSSNQAGRLEQQEEMKEDFPYWMYDAIEDSRTTDFCSEMDGKIYKANDPIWDGIYPPNHFNCRSTVIALDKEDFEELKSEGNNKYIPNSKRSKLTEETLKKQSKQFKGKPTNNNKKIENNIEKKD